MRENRRPTITPAALNAFLAGDIDNFVAAATPGGIEAQEKAGQTSFVANSSLPKDGTDGSNRETFEKLGFRFGADVDDLFVAVTMPDGWKKKATEHSMWSDLLDGKGRKRAGIFYKAAFYDRNAHINLSRRFSVSSYISVNVNGEPMEYPSSHNAVVVVDGETEIYRAGICESQDDKAHEQLEHNATAWLKNAYPNYEDPTAYWD